MTVAGRRFYLNHSGIEICAQVGITKETLIFYLNHSGIEIKLKRGRQDCLPIFYLNHSGIEISQKAYDLGFATNFT